MAVGVTVGSITDELGARSFVHSFFSTISVHCEPTGWSSRFPHLMNELYQGRFAARERLARARGTAAGQSDPEQFAPDGCGVGHREPPVQTAWGDTIASHITSLGDYFVSSTGREVFGILEEALAASAKEQRDAVLE